MPKKEVLRLFKGFKKFKQRYFIEENSLYGQLSTQGQSPKTLIIGCSDSRVDPAILTSAEPGELFIVRNVANLVPPYETTGNYHGVSSAIEFAVTNLKIENIIVLGHSQCGGIRALMIGGQELKGTFVHRWMQIAAQAKERALKLVNSKDEKALCRACETEAILVSLNNLKSFPFVQEAIKTRNLKLIGIYFDLEQGEILQCDDSDTVFRHVETD